MHISFISDMRLTIVTPGVPLLSQKKSNAIELNFNDDQQKQQQQKQQHLLHLFQVSTEEIFNLNFTHFVKAKEDIKRKKRVYFIHIFPIGQALRANDALILCENELGSHRKCTPAPLARQIFEMRWMYSIVLSQYKNVLLSIWSRFLDILRQFKYVDAKSWIHRM